MKKYVALLRGININGKNKISMSVLKTEFESAGFSEVTTYLNSGNIVFESDTDSNKIIIEKMILDKFGLEIPVYVMEMDALIDIMLNAPDWWGTDSKEYYDNLIFMLSSDTPKEICDLIGELSVGLEKVQTYKNVIFWSFDRKTYQKCNWWKKTACAGIAEKLTIRTASTVKKVMN